MTARLHGVLVTYRRLNRLKVMLERLEGQTRGLDTLVVVDNCPGPESAALVADHTSAAGVVEYVPAPDNLGPAGGIALGMRRLLQVQSDEDWVVTLDDDDPPGEATLLADLLCFGERMLGRDPRTAGVGLMGARFDFKRARMVRIVDGELSGCVTVDYIGGNQFPCYRLAAVRALGPFRSELFFGLEELEFGLRLRAAGYSLYAHGDLWAVRRRRNGRTDLVVGPTVRMRPGKRKLVWRRYYNVRNLVAILRAHGHHWTAARAGLTRGVGKPLINVVLDPAGSVPHLRAGARAVYDGWMGRLGRTVEPGG